METMAASRPKQVEKSKISVKNLDFYYGKFHALKNINLEIPEKKVTAFIGPSGCGKSTLLRILTECTSSTLSSELRVKSCSRVKICSHLKRTWR